MAGTMRGYLNKARWIEGYFTGVLDTRTMRLNGSVAVREPKSKHGRATLRQIPFFGYFATIRTIDFTQYVEGDFVGGVSVRLKIPLRG